MPPQMTCASALPGNTGNMKITFFTQMLYYSRALQQLDCVARTVHQCAVFLKEELSSVMCLVVSTFVEIVRYPIHTVHWLNNPIFYTATNAMTDLVNMWVTGF